MIRRSEIFYSFVLVFFNFISQIIFVEGQGNCRTPLNTNGYCINLLNCQSLLDLLKRSNSYSITYLQSATCGFEGIYPLVCCEENSQNGPVTPAPTSIIIPTFLDANDQVITTVPVTEYWTNPPVTYPPETNPPATYLPVTDPPETELPRTDFPETEPPETSYPETSTLPRTPNCGISSVSTTRVVNGNPAKLGEFPWMAALGYKNSKNPSIPRWLCAGSLITQKHILTAGHCTYNRTDLYIARLGELDLYSDNDGASPVDVLIDKIKLHEQYEPSSITNDIAILTLANPVSGKHISPLCLPLDEPLKSKDFVRYYPFVAGWGSIFFDGPSSSHLAVVMLPVVSNEQCRQAFSTFKKTVIDDRSLCAGYATGGKDACQGDSGGPLMLVNGRDPYTYYQIGIVSYGYRCAEVGIPGVYTRITYFLNWIEKNVY